MALPERNGVSVHRGDRQRRGPGPLGRREALEGRPEVDSTHPDGRWSSRSPRVSTRWRCQMRSAWSRVKVAIAASSIPESNAWLVSNVIDAAG